MAFRADDDADDLRLLSRYAHERDEAAFATVVRRHVGMVYAAAVRRVGDRHLAEDVTQAVFVVLAKKARSMSTSGRPLSLWLLTTVRFCAANALRIERRRRRWESSDDRALVDIPQPDGSCSSNPTDVLIWQEVAARLDDAVLALPAADRRAVLLRFFEDRPMRDIAANLNVTEVAARQRVGRAVEKLRQRLDRLGAGGLALSGAAGLERLLEAQLRASAYSPPGLADAACTTATTGVAAGAGITIAKGAIHMMMLAKTKLVAAVATAAVVAGIGGASLINRADATDQRANSSERPQVAQTLALAPATPLLAASAADKAPKDEVGPRRGGINSVAAAPPVVVKTVPQAGADDVDPALTEIKVTFSKEMTDGNWSFPKISKETAVNSTGKPHFEDDGRTCVLPVKLEPGKTYVIPLNKKPFDSFMDKDHRRAMEYLLVFETKKE